jgi:hypothetical protein
VGAARALLIGAEAIQRAEVGLLAGEFSSRAATREADRPLSSVPSPPTTCSPFQVYPAGGKVLAARHGAAWACRAAAAAITERGRAGEQVTEAWLSGPRQPLPVRGQLAAGGFVGGPVHGQDWAQRGCRPERYAGPCGGTATGARR